MKIKFSRLWAVVLFGGCVCLWSHSPAFSDTDEKPPAGAKDASCRYDNGTPSFCKVKVTEGSPAQVQVWIPEGRQSATTLTYKGECLREGCVLTGEDFGYAIGPARYRVLQFSRSIIRWKELNGNNAEEEFRILEP